VVATVGILTAIYAASIALVNTDIKRVLAYSTISQLGYMFVAVGVGAYTAGIFHLATHAFFKALLFLGAGSVIHALSGEQDLRKMGGLNKHLRVTAPTFLIAVLAIAGCPPFSGFFSKDEILAGAFHSGHYFIWFLGIITAGMTAFYMFRLLFLAFYSESRVESETAKHLHESPKVMTIPLIILAIFAAIAGFVGIPGKHGTMFGSFLGAVFGVEHAEFSLGLELALMAISVIAAGIGFYIAWLMYIKKTLNPEKVANRVSRLYQLILNKYYVDEVYDTILINPTKRLAENLWRAFDDRVVDGTVNGVASLVEWSGGIIRRIQTGYVASYAMLFVLGIIVVLGYMLMK